MLRANAALQSYSNIPSADRPSSEAALGGEFRGVPQPGEAGESHKPHAALRALDGSYLAAHVVCFTAESVIQHLQALNAERSR